MHVPRALPLFGRRGGDQVKPVRQLAQDEDRAREAIAFAVDLRPHVVTEGGPPQITLGHERRLVV